MGNFISAILFLAVLFYVPIYVSKKVKEKEKKKKEADKAECEKEYEKLKNKVWKLIGTEEVKGWPDGIKVNYLGLKKARFYFDVSTGNSYLVINYNHNGKKVLYGHKCRASEFELLKREVDEVDELDLDGETFKVTNDSTFLALFDSDEDAVREYNDMERILKNSRNLIAPNLESWMYNWVGWVYRRD